MATNITIVHYVSPGTHNTIYKYSRQMIEPLPDQGS